jgi:tetratricopeptide (TPR) repeat protein
MNVRLFSVMVLLTCLAGLRPLSAQNSGTGSSQSAALQNYRTGRDLEGRGRMNEATVYYNEAIRICNDEVARNAVTRDTYATYALTYQRLQRYSEVIRWGESGLRLYPDDYRIVEVMGEAYFYLNNYDACLRFMQRYANAMPQGDRTSVAYFFIGEIYRLTQRYHRADIAYTMAVHLEPNSALWWYRLGSVREEVREFSSAITAYERALRLNPNYRDASAGLERSRRAYNR